MDEKKKVPKLRFKGFTDDWEQRKWKEIMLVNSGRDYKHLNEGKIPVYGTGGYMLSVDKSLSNIDAIGIGRKGTIDKPQYLSAPFWTVDTLFFMTPLKRTNLKFLYALSQNINWKKYDESTGLPSLSKTTINNIVVKLPHNNEQNKIGKLISQIDNLLILQQRKLKQLKFIKKAMVQKLFTTKNVPNLRFKGFNSNWEQRKLKEISTKCVKKNKDSLNLPVLTNSAIQGIVFQAQFFDKSIAKKINNYYLVRPDDFVYNPRISNNAPFGPIRRNKLSNIGVMSPLYYVFSLKDKVNKDFMEYYFMSSRWHRFMYKNGDSGARSDRFSIKDDIFKNMPIIIPTMKEQEKIGAFLKMLNHYIDLQQDKISKLQTYKRFLLQNMFI